MNSIMLMLHAEKEGFKLPVWATFDRITGLNYVKDKQGARQDAVDSEGNKLPLVSVNKGAKSFPVFITTYIPFFLASNYVPDMEPKKRKAFLIAEWALVAVLLVILIPLGVI